LTQFIVKIFISQINVTRIEEIDSHIKAAEKSLSLVALPKDF
jgi:hypothetical protein